MRTPNGIFASYASKRGELMENYRAYLKELKTTTLFQDIPDEELIALLEAMQPKIVMRLSLIHIWITLGPVAGLWWGFPGRIGRFLASVRWENRGWLRQAGTVQHLSLIHI